MINTFLKNTERTNLFVALVVLIGSLIVYLKTLAPTLSFWDCGEFIAVSAILGIPHPPGTPLYVMLGHIFAIIPSYDDISARVNLLSAISSSFAALFCYLSGVRLLRMWFNGAKGFLNRLLLYGGPASGALVAAFGLTNWNNAVEAEVYGPAMMLLTAIFWLTLVYLDTDNLKFRNKIMLLAVYLAFLGISVHMTAFLILPVVALVFILKKETPTHIWFILAAYVLFELYLIFALSSRPGEVPYYIPILIVFVIYMFFIFSFEQIRRLYLVAAVGFVLAMAPVFGAVYSGFLVSSGKSSAISASTQSLLNSIGVVSFIVLLLVGLFGLVKYFKLKNTREQSSHYLHVSMFILTASLMTFLLKIEPLKGYKPFLVLSVVLTGIVALLIYRHINWPILIGLAGPMLIVVGVMPLVYGAAAAAAVLIAGGFLFRISGWSQGLLIILVSIVGFSSHVFIPIRSAQQPAINENNPSRSLQATINYLERKQYGSQSMIERMFNRRGEWTNQFGNYQRMGFWRFFSEQFALKGSAFVFPLLIGIFGIWEVVRRGPPRGVILLLLILISSAGLVLYMNFADGTRQHPVSGADYIEVRERDYFFTPAFVMFGLAIGLGTAAVIQYVNESLKKTSQVLRRGVVGIACLILLLPVVVAAENYHYSDRSDNFVPFDYGWNLLNSADENAIFFTSGDNDTFPLWCLQEAYGIRKDVRVVNLSLSNTDWYIKQLAPNLGLNFSLSDDEIDRLRPFRTSDGTVVRIHHQIIDRLIDENYGQIPVNFSVTVGADNRRYKSQSIDSLLSLRGFSWRLFGQTPGFGVDVEEGYDFFMNPEKFRCRGANDPNVYLDDSAERLTRNLANGFMVVADTLRKAKDFDRAEKLLMRARYLIPRATDPVQLLARIYSESGKVDAIQVLIDTCLFDSREQLYYYLGLAQKDLGNESQAEESFNAALSLNPGYRPAFDELMRIYMKQERANAMRSGLLRWLQFNPQDQKIRELYFEMEKKINETDTSRDAVK